MVAFLYSQCLLQAGKAPIGSHLFLATLVATDENNSRKQSAPVTEGFFASRGCPLMRASTILIKLTFCTPILKNSFTCRCKRG